MEKHRCKLCHRNFANGRALGGHMRSHMMNLYASSKAKQEFVKQQQQHHDHEVFLMNEEIESVPSSSSSSSEDEDEEEEEEDVGGNGVFSYGMSTNHLKKRGGGGGGGMAMADSDHQFCFGGGAEAAGSVVLQDRESETESSKNPIRRRSRRVRKSRISDAIRFSEYKSSIKQSTQERKPRSSSEKKQGMIPSEMVMETEQPVSSISDTTPEEDVAHCLMMLSRDKWLRRDSEEEHEQEQEQEQDFDSEEEEEEEEENEKKRKKMYNCHDFGVVKVTKSSRSRGGKYRCETCNKVFRSYQALGGHRASHKRIKVQNSSNYSTEEEQKGGMMKLKQHHQTTAVSSSLVIEEKIHECPVCFRVFSSGQALGGHKRSHVMGAAAAATQHHHLIHHVSTTTTTTTNTTVPVPVPVPVSAAPKKQPFSRFGESFIDLNLPAPVDDDEEEEDDISQIELSAVSDAEFVNPFKH